MLLSSYDYQSVPMLLYDDHHCCRPYRFKTQILECLHFEFLIIILPF